MSDTFKTVKIKTEAGPVYINESDYDAAKHELHVEEAAPVVPPAPPAPPASEDESDAE